MLPELFKLIAEFLRKNIGLRGTVLILCFVLGMYVALSYDRFVVTPNDLLQAKKELSIKIEKSAAKGDLKLNELRISLLRGEKYSLQTIIDARPKRRDIERLKEITDEIKALETENKDIIKILEQ